MTVLGNDMPLWTDWLMSLATPAKPFPTLDEPLRFEGFQLYRRERLLSEDGERVQIGDRALDILITLVERPGTVVTKAELLSKVWGNIHVDDGALRFQIAVLRKLLSDGENGRRFIVNVISKGYVFVGSLR